MASSAQLKIIIDAATGGAESALGSLDGKLSGLGKFGKVAAIGLGAAAAGAAVVGTAAIAGAAGVLKLTMEAAKVEQSRVTFGRLAEDIGSTAGVMIKDLRNATRGMVSDADLWATSNKLVTMGLATTSQEAAKLAEIGSQLGISMGRDAVGAMEDFGLMLANSSIPRLDTFGISASKVRERMVELTGETKAAFASEEDLNRERDTTLDKIGELEGKLKLAAMQQDEFNTKTKDSTKLAKKMQIDKLSTELDDLRKYYQSLDDAVIDTNKAMDRQAAFLQAVREQAEITMKRVGEQGVGAMQDMDRLKATFDNIGKGIGRAFLPALGKVATAIRENLLKYEPQIQAFAENAGKWLAEKLPGMLEGAARGITTAAKGIGEGLDSIAGFLAAGKQEWETFASEMEATKTRLDASELGQWFKDVVKDIEENPPGQALYDALVVAGEEAPKAVQKTNAELLAAWLGIDVPVKEKAEQWTADIKVAGDAMAQSWIATAPPQAAAIGEVGRTIQGSFQDQIPQMAKSAEDLIVRPWQESIPRLQDQMHQTAAAASTGMAGVVEGVATEAAKVPEAVATGMGEAATAASTGMAEVATAVSTSAEGMATAAQTGMDGVALTFTTGWTGLATEATTQMTAIATAVTTGMTGVATAVTTGFVAVTGAFTTGFSSIGTVTVAGAMLAVTSAVVTGMGNVAMAVTTGMTGVKAAFSAGMSLVRFAATTGMALVRAAVTTGMNNVRTAVTGGMNTVITAFRTGFSRAVGVVRGAINDIKGAVSSGMRLVRGHISGATTVVNGLGNTFSSVAGSISRSVSRIVASAEKAATALAKIKIPSGLAQGSPSPFENTLMGVNKLMREMSQRTIPEFSAALASTGSSQESNYYYTLNVNSSASTEPIIADFMVLEALAGA